MYKVVIARMLLSRFCTIGSTRLRRFVIDILPWKAVHDIRDISDAMHKTSVELVGNARDAALDADSKSREFMSVLLRSNLAEVKSANRLSMEEVIGQVS